MIRYRTTWAILCHIVMCLIIFMVSCRVPEETDTDLSVYYLPVDALGAEGQEYIYRNLTDTTLAGEIWRHQKTSEGRITSINYDHNQQVVQKQYERVVQNGVVIDSLLLFFYDSLGRTISLPVRVHSPHRFPFNPKDSSQVWLTHLEWWQPGDSLHIVLQRRRRFMGKTTWDYDGKSIPAVRFRTEDTFETERDGWSNSMWTGEEVYAKGIGLVYYRRDISPQMRFEFELERRE